MVNGKFLSVLGALTLGSAVASTEALAQKAVGLGPNSMCFMVVPAPANVAPFTLMKVDRCTGTTWVLSRRPIPDPSGKPSTAGVWHWTPVEE
jgi:hypothetical protein